MPGLFDSLDDFSESVENDFSIIPDEKMEEIVREMQRDRQRPDVIDELPQMKATEKVFFMSFGSGSSGNCSYVGDREGGFLIDAGVEIAKGRRTAPQRYLDGPSGRNLPHA